MGARAIGHVVINAHGEGIRLLEDHADALAQQVHVHFAGKNILAVQRDGALDAAALHEVVHAVEGLEQRRLAAAGRADEGRDLIGGQAEVDVLQRLKAAIPEIEVLDYDLILFHMGTPSCCAHCVRRAIRFAAAPDSALMPMTMTSSTTAVA